MYFLIGTFGYLAKVYGKSLGLGGQPVQFAAVVNALPTASFAREDNGRTHGRRRTRAHTDAHGHAQHAHTMQTQTRTLHARARACMHSRFFLWACALSRARSRPAVRIRACFGKTAARAGGVADPPSLPARSRWRAPGRVHDHGALRLHPRHGRGRRLPRPPVDQVLRRGQGRLGLPRPH